MGNGLNNSWRFGILLAVLLLGGIAVNAWEYLDEARVPRSELKDFPKQVGTWKQVGGDDRFDVQTESILRADDYLLRNYQSQDGRFASFYVGYYATQRNGATYHSPLNCLPGSGWVMTDPARITITPRDGSASFEANRFVVANGRDRALMIYWYQGRGRAVASEYWGKIYTVIDSVRHRGCDGAMVRITTPIESSEADAVNASLALAGGTSAILPEFIPD